MWCVVLKHLDRIGYEVLEERFQHYDDAFSFGQQKEKETGRSFGVDAAPYPDGLIYDYDDWIEDEDLICANCGERLGSHNGGCGEIE